MTLATVAAIWLHLCGLALLTGGAVVVVELAPGGGGAPRLIRTGLALAVAGQVAWLASVLTGLLGEFTWPALDDLRALLLHMPFGWVWMARGALLVLLALRLARRPMDRASLAIALALAASLAMTGHVMSVGGGHAGHLAMHALHAVAACAWIGSLPVLHMGLRGEPQAARAILARYGAFGGACLAGLLIGGVATTVGIVGQTPETLSADYLAALTVKLGLLTAMLLLAADNRLRQTPLALAGDDAALRRIARNSRWEFGLGLLVLLAAAFLAQTAP